MSHKKIAERMAEEKYPELPAELASHAGMRYGYASAWDHREVQDTA